MRKEEKNDKKSKRFYEGAKQHVEDKKKNKKKAGEKMQERWKK